ncbi:MAG: helix-turn-helix domain-containing protein [Candidatus Eutrophobiaceae bacterium]
MDSHCVDDLHHLFMGTAERCFLRTVLEHCRGNLSQTALLLGISRTTLRKRMKSYALNSRDFDSLSEIPKPNIDSRVRKIS